MFTSLTLLSSRTFKVTKSTMAFIAIMLTFLLATNLRNACAEELFVPTPTDVLRIINQLGNKRITVKFVDLNEAREIGDIKPSILKQGPFNQSGRHGAAFTYWKINWQPEGADGNKKYKVDYSAEIKMIRWTPEARPTTESISAWNKLIKLVIAHEGRHVETAIYGVGKVDQAIKQAISRQPQIEDQAVTQIVKSTLSDIRQKDVDYDRQTDGGRAQGIIFP